MSDQFFFTSSRKARRKALRKALSKSKRWKPAFRRAFRRAFRDEVKKACDGARVSSVRSLAEERGSGGVRRGCCRACRGDGRGRGVAVRFAPRRARGGWRGCHAPAEGGSTACNVTSTATTRRGAPAGRTLHYMTQIRRMREGDGRSGAERRRSFRRSQATPPRMASRGGRSRAPPPLPSRERERERERASARARQKKQPRRPPFRAAAARRRFRGFATSTYEFGDIHPPRTFASGALPPFSPNAAAASENDSNRPPRAAAPRRRAADAAEAPVWAKRIIVRKSGRAGVVRGRRVRGCKQ